MNADDRPECKVEGCDKVSVSRGYCQKHYHRWYRDPKAPIKLKPEAQAKERRVQPRKRGAR